MTIEFELPELGENIHSGDVVKVLVREGQQVTAGQGIVEMETDKAVVEIPCPQAGKVAKLHVKKGDTVKVGQLLVTLEGSAKPAAAAQKPSTASAPASAPSAAPKSAPTAAPVALPEVPDGPDDTGPIPAGPAVRREARERGIDLRGVQGTGPHGRITMEDLSASTAAAAAPAASSGRPASAPAKAPVQTHFEPVVPGGEPGQDNWGPVRREKLSQIRRTIAAHMVRSATVIPHVTNFDDADVTDLDQFRKSVPPGWLGANLKLTTMPFVLKAVATALRRHPMVNAMLDEENGQIVYKQYVNLGVAVDTPRGLVVPVLRDVDRMGIPELARALLTLAERARGAQFAVDELRGGTFTISNLGAVGGTYSTPIINHPEVALLLLGRSRWMPVVRGDEIQKRLMMPLSLSYDHRLVDGATAARFLNEVIDYLQSPGKLMFV